jgi:peptidyl-prolyl cis-trans isomerase B (cyclophilin B)
VKTVTALLILGLIVMGLTLTAAQDSNTSKKEEPPVTGRWAIIETNRGTIKLALYEEDMPITTKNFIDLANAKFFDGLKFHRVEDWVIQTGDPTGTGAGGSGKTIKLETSPKLKHDKIGVVGMARLGHDLHSATSQFYIIRRPAQYLDGKYAVFAQVVEGLEVVKSIQKNDVVESIRIVPAPRPKSDEKSTDVESKDKDCQDCKKNNEQTEGQKDSEQKEEKENK